MGIEIAIIIASVSAFISLIAGGVSVASIHNSQHHSSSKKQEDVGADMRITLTQENFAPEQGGSFTFDDETTPIDSHSHKYYHSSGIVSRVVQEKVIHLTGKDNEEILHSAHMVRTGLPNKTSEILGKGATVVYSSLKDSAKEEAIKITEEPQAIIPLLGEESVPHGAMAEID